MARGETVQERRKTGGSQYLKSNDEVQPRLGERQPRE